MTKRSGHGSRGKKHINTLRGNEMLSEVRGCDSKTSFPSRRKARARARARILNERRGLTLAPYKCRHCKAWHLSKRER
jgi:hypothetical protein